MSLWLQAPDILLGQFLHLPPWGAVPEGWLPPAPLPGPSSAEPQLLHAAPPCGRKQGGAGGLATEPVAVTAAVLLLLGLRSLLFRELHSTNLGRAAPGSRVTAATMEIVGPVRGRHRVEDSGASSSVRVPAASGVPCAGLRPQDWLVARWRKALRASGTVQCWRTGLLFGVGREAPGPRGGSPPGSVRAQIATWPSGSAAGRVRGPELVPGSNQSPSVTSAGVLRPAGSLDRCTR